MNVFNEIFDWLVKSGSIAGIVVSVVGIISGLIWLIKKLLTRLWSKEKEEKNDELIESMKYDKRLAEERLKLVEDNFAEQLKDYKELHNKVMEHGYNVVKAIANNQTILNKMSTIIESNTEAIKGNSETIQSNTRAIDEIIKSLIEITKNNIK